MTWRDRHGCWCWRTTPPCPRSCAKSSRRAATSPRPRSAWAAGRAALHSCEFDVALLDLMLPDGSGIDLLRVMVEDELATEAIVLTGYAAVSTALEAMKLGAYDYLTKPVRMDELDVLVDKAGEKARLRRENVRLRTHLEQLDTPAGIVTSDPPCGACWRPSSASPPRTSPCRC